MKFVRGDIKKPKDGDYYNGKAFNGPILVCYNKARDIYIDYDADEYHPEDIEWLDEESNEPVFSLEDMRKSWEDGEFNGVYNFQQNLGSKDAATFKDFMKEQYKILIP